MANTLVDEERKIQRGSRLGWSQQPRDRSGPQTDRPKLWLQCSSTNAGGPAGEIGGFITPAGEPAFYGKVITPVSFSNTLSASGILNVPQGGGHT
jgi:hypothetical protein